MAVAMEEIVMEAVTEKEVVDMEEATTEDMEKVS